MIPGFKQYIELSVFLDYSDRSDKLYQNEE